MKNKSGKIILIILVGITGLWVVARLTGTIQLYTVPTPSMEPTVKVGSIIFSSNLITPKDGDIICFKHREADNSSTTYFKRLTGLPGEVLSIKNGLVYINGKLNDDSAKVYRYYITTQEIYERHNRQLTFSDSTYIQNVGDSIIIPLATVDLQKFSKNERPSLYHPKMDSETESGFFYFKHNGSVDDLSDIKIPADSCFVIGDSRGNSVDSRYFGFVSLKDIRGVVLNKK